MSEVFDFNALDPGDGVRVEVVACGGELSLHARVNAGGEPVNLGTVGADPEDATVALTDPVPAGGLAWGELDRLHAALEGVARYLSTGGDWGPLLRSLQRLQRLVPSGLLFPGWHYHSGEAVYDPDLRRVLWQHLFVADEDVGTATRAVLWLEDVFVEEKTLQAVLAEIDHAQEREGPEVLPGRSLGNFLDLPGQQDPADAERPGGDPGF